MQPQPTPTEYGIGFAEDPNGEKFIILTFATFSGQQVYFFDKAAAQAFAVKLKEQADELSDLILVKTIVPPDVKQPQDHKRKVRDAAQEVLKGVVGEAAL